MFYIDAESYKDAKEFVQGEHYAVSELEEFVAEYFFFREYVKWLDSWVFGEAIKELDQSVVEYMRGEDDDAEKLDSETT